MNFLQSLDRKDWVMVGAGFVALLGLVTVLFVDPANVTRPTPKGTQPVQSIDQTPAILYEPIPFQVGDQLGDLRITEIKPFFENREQPVHASNAIIITEGQIEISGTYISVALLPFYTPEGTLSGEGDTADCFKPDEQSRVNLPTLSERDSGTFCFTNAPTEMQQLRQLSEEGTATIAIRNYHRFICDCHGSRSSAELVEVIKTSDEGDPSL